MADELRVLEGLVDALSRRFCQALGSDGASGTTPPTHMRNVGGRAAVSPPLHCHLGGRNSKSRKRSVLVAEPPHYSSDRVS